MPEPTRSEREKMLSGELYNPYSPELVHDRLAARQRTEAFNASPSEDTAGRHRKLRALIPNAGRRLWIEPPFHCDYGAHIHIGDDVYMNFNCVILDVCPVRIGSRVKLGPSVQIYTATHPLDAAERASRLESGEPVEIGDDVWIGGGAILCPGVRVGARSVIGAGSVVTRDIPEDVVAAGSPCRVLRKLGGKRAKA